MTGRLLSMASRVVWRTLTRRLPVNRLTMALIRKMTVIPTLGICCGKMLGSTIRTTITIRGIRLIHRLRGCSSF